MSRGGSIEWEYVNHVDDAGCDNGLKGTSHPHAEMLFSGEVTQNSIGLLLPLG